MTQDERRLWLIKYLIDESPRYRELEIPSDKLEQFKLYRSLVNVRDPKPASEDYLKIEDEFLQTENAEKGIVSISQAKDFGGGIYLWQGDITRLAADAIVNAANSQMLGCFMPCHSCIDNGIHTYAGIRLRLKCNEIMSAQGYPEPTGKAKITPAYNLPCKFVIHTVGPIVDGKLTQSHENLLASCYRECLKTADENGLESIAFCCISTGVFSFPNERAAEIAIKAVKDYKAETKSNIKVIFNVFKDTDLHIYNALL